MNSDDRKSAEMVLMAGIHPHPVKAVSGWGMEADFGLAYYRTSGPLTMTFGGRMENRIELEEGRD